MYRIITVIVVYVFVVGCTSWFPESSERAYPQAARFPHHNKDTKGRDYFPEKRVATGNKIFIFDPSVSAWAAYNQHGERVKTGRASGGKSYCADVRRGCKTVRGKFRVYRKQGSECESSKFPLNTNGGAPMPYCMHFYKGYAIHGSYNVPNHNASHGCIRVYPSAARWLNREFMSIGTAVMVSSY